MFGMNTISRPEQIAKHIKARIIEASLNKDPILYHVEWQIRPYNKPWFYKHRFSCCNDESPVMVLYNRLNGNTLYFSTNCLRTIEVFDNQIDAETFRRLPTYIHKYLSHRRSL